MKRSGVKCGNPVPVTKKHLSMATSCPQLDRQTEKQLCMFFNGNVKFSLLYQGSCHGFNFTEIQHKCTNQGQIIMVGYLEDGLVLGGCMSKGLINQNTTLKDETAFHFSASQSEPVKTVHFEHNAVRFDSDLRFFQSNVRNNTVSVTSSQLEGEKILEELEVYRVEEACDLLETPWRELTSTEEKRNLLKESVVSYKPPTDAVSQARVLLVGPVGAGKSSFISSVCSVFHGRVSIQAMVGTAARSFTTKFRSYTIKAARGGEATPLVLCDMMGLGENDLSGVKVKDVLQVIKGHVPEGYKGMDIITAHRLVEGTVDSLRQSARNFEGIKCAADKFVQRAKRKLQEEEELRTIDVKVPYDQQFLIDSYQPVGTIDPDH
ncbi:interferon-induced protein 44-like [Polypterus senegalus]|uniref:interferon-induced protein 44-like n=1 Tax=Polypterus senegalus TaxID=55291 RepID=UPI001963CDA1|nr:interferon-induced protein 44-like [Polypterus senegalus]